MLAGATPASLCYDLGINPKTYSEYVDVAGLSGKFLDIVDDASDKHSIITPKAYLQSLYENGIKNYDSDTRPYTIDVFNEVLYGLKYPYVALDSTHRILKVLLDHVLLHPPSQDEQCFLMFVSAAKIRIRPTTFMGTYNLGSSETGFYTPVNTHLTHFLDSFCFFTVEEIEELEFLINDPRITEGKLQRFFETHPNFLLGNQYKRLHSQVILLREDQGPLIPDFMLEGPEGELSKIVDLKRPNQRFVRHKKNRLGFLQSLMEARDQLIEYRDYFENINHRKMFEQKTGLKAYRPRIVVIIGRNRDYGNFYRRQTLKSRAPDIEIKTYDDILQMAKSRQIVFEEVWKDIIEID